MKRNSNDPVIIFDRKIGAGAGGKQSSQDNACRDFPPIFQGMDRFEKYRLVSSHGAADFKRRRRGRAPDTEVFLRIGSQGKAADRAERRCKKGDAFLTVRTEAAVLSRNQEVMAGQAAGRKEKIDKALEESIQDYIPSFKRSSSVVSSGISIRGTSAQRRSRS